MANIPDFFDFSSFQHMNTFSAIHDGYGRRRGIDKRKDDINKDEEMKEDAKEKEAEAMGLLTFVSGCPKKL